MLITAYILLAVAVELSVAVALGRLISSRPSYQPSTSLLAQRLKPIANGSLFKLTSVSAAPVASAGPSGALL